MSFSDLERGSTSRTNNQASRFSTDPSSTSASSHTRLPLYRTDISDSSVVPVDAEFERLSKRIGIQIFKINSNITAIQKLISLLSTPSSLSTDWTKRIHDLTETTRELIKDGTNDLKTFSAIPLGSKHTAGKITQSKLQRDFQTAAIQFQKVQRDSVDKTRQALEQDKKVKRKSNSQSLVQSSLPLQEQEQEAGRESSGIDHLQQPILLEQQHSISQSELDYQSSLIASREAEIREIETGVQELNEIFRDLGNIVQEQGGMIDNIEFNITSVAENTQGADTELIVAHEYQRKAGRRALCLIVIVGFVVAVVLLAILS